MLDQMSGGRLDIGFGRGSLPIEVAYYGVDPQVRQQIYAERLELALQALSPSKSLSFTGTYDRFENVPLELEPLQKPHPPIYYGAHSPDSAERAARKGFNIINNDVPAITRACIDRYREVWCEVFGAAAPLPKMGMVRFIVVAERDATALAAARRAYPIWLRSFNYLFRMHGNSPLTGERPPDFDALAARGLGVAGTPETVLACLAPSSRIRAPTIWSGSSRSATSRSMKCSIGRAVYARRDAGLACAARGCDEIVEPVHGP